MLLVIYQAMCFFPFFLLLFLFQAYSKKYNWRIVPFFISLCSFLIIVRKYPRFFFNYLDVKNLEPGILGAICIF